MCEQVELLYQLCKQYLAGCSKARFKPNNVSSPEPIDDDVPSEAPSETNETASVAETVIVERKGPYGWKHCDLLMFAADDLTDAAAQLDNQGYVKAARVKDSSGHEWSAINGRFKGFMCKPVKSDELSNGTLKSPYPIAYLQSIRQLYGECHLYFVDFYCDAKTNGMPTHKVTLLACHRMPESLTNEQAEVFAAYLAHQQAQIQYCKRSFISLNWNQNAFLRFSKSECRFLRRAGTGLSVQLFMMVPPIWHHHNVSLLNFPASQVQPDPTQGRTIKPPLDCPVCSPDSRLLQSPFLDEFKTNVQKLKCALHEQEIAKMTKLPRAVTQRRPPLDMGRDRGSRSVSSNADSALGESMSSLRDLKLLPTYQISNDESQTTGGLDKFFGRDDEGFLRFVEQKLRDDKRSGGKKTPGVVELEKLVKEYKKNNGIL